MAMQILIRHSLSHDTCRIPSIRMNSGPSRFFRLRGFPLFAAALALVPSLHAEVKMPAIFGDHMVLQQEQKVPVWGWADPGEKVTVIVGDHTGSATADDKGKWRIDLAPFAPNTPALTVMVAGKNTLKFEDVLIGEV